MKLACGQADRSCRHRTPFRLPLLLAASLLVLSPAYAERQNSERQGSDALLEGFGNPPNAARPRVWWHWMNGNITADGIEKDLAWMKRIGLGGVQNFDASRKTPQIVEKRLVYMSPGWRDAFGFAVSTADRLGLEFAIASSPGWSETGGPWVAPQDGMKKLVWSETTVAGGRRFNGILPVPPSTTGPYQAIASTENHSDRALPRFYRDTLVLAYPQPEADELPAPARALVKEAEIDSALLLDQDAGTGIPLPANTAEGPGAATFAYARPQTIRSAVVMVANAPGAVLAGPLRPTLEASNDGLNWRKIAEVQITNVPTTISFAPVKARSFRLVMTRGKRADLSSFAPAPGADPKALSVDSMSSGDGSAQPLLAEFRLLPGARVNAAEHKAGFALVDDYYALDGHVTDDPSGIAPPTVIDLTGRMAADGRIDWTPPPGRWKVLRFGYSLTGKMNHPATAEATGLEVDKYDAAAVERYLRSYLSMYRDITGSTLMGERGLSAMVMDSTEVGPSNWTSTLIEQFARLRGYDPLPWLPALAGEIVGSRARSDAFLYDFRRTLAELAATEHYGTIARVAHDFGLKVYGESLEGTRAVSTLGDDIDMRRFADIPMGAMWAYGRAPAPYLLADMRGASSVAHLYGRPVAAAESLTSILAPWAHTPSDLRPMIDAEFANGINRAVIHTSVHQPADDKIPGLSLGVYGQFFTRHETWADMAKPWIDYIARNSFMLQQGRNVADIAYFYGEEAPIGVQAKDGYIPDVPRRYAYDFVSAEGLMNELSVEAGDLVSRGGARYRAIFLGGTSRKMTLPALRKIAALVEAGATAIGDAPESSPTLGGDPVEFAALVKRLWNGNERSRVGQGRVIAGRNVETALATAGIAPDFAIAGGQPDSDVQFVHRRLDSGDLYFVTNRMNRPEKLEARFRVMGKGPEIWRADTGRSEPVSYRIDGTETVVPLDMLPLESFFVVFRKPAAAPSARVPAVSYVPVGSIGGQWSVAFQPGRGAPASITLYRLAPLSEHSNAGVKYFSGVATYTTTFMLPQGVERGAPLLLDLGEIGDVAEVRVNDQPAGTAWKVPYRVEVGRLVRRGRNTLEVRVANLWVNRLIGDQQPGAQKVTFTTLPTYTPKAPLRKAGLIGPVRLLRQAQQ